MNVELIDGREISRLDEIPTFLVRAWTEVAHDSWREELWEVTQASVLEAIEFAGSSRFNSASRVEVSVRFTDGFAEPASTLLCIFQSDSDLPHRRLPGDSFGVDEDLPPYLFAT
ncbi:hypothetical protein [Haematomicrobium sanguinis]|uniref:hypothetical protein n=1 Tax=Haematomicrobium sanguinis TaxID=479106 RepID=UPI0012FA933D|nr:hypothetical protein [Haematomicrobium sanguinis]